MKLESFRKHPARYFAPWVMTVSRPVLGQIAVVEAKKGNLKNTHRLLVAAMASDMEGYPARYLNAISIAGAVADPIADGILRAQTAYTLAPHMSKLTTAFVALAEGDSLRLNARIQKGRENPLVPKGAKWGSAIEGLGAEFVMEGIIHDDRALRIAGQVAIVAGAALRHRTYHNIYRREVKKGSL